MSSSIANPKSSRVFKLACVWIVLAFCITPLAVSATSADVIHHEQPESTLNHQAAVFDEIQPLKLKCGDVHHAEDKCAFVAKYCEDDATGIFAYLDLYFCDMQSAKPVYWIIMATWLFTLFASIGVSASEFLTINLGSLSTKLKMSHSLAGVTLLALGNGSPDLFSTFTAMSNHSGSLALGELIGAAGFITTVVAAATAFPRPFRVKKYGFIRDVVFFATAVGFSLFFLIDGRLSLWECITMVLFYVLYVVTVFSWDFILRAVGKRKKRNARARSHFGTNIVHTGPRQPYPVAMGDFDALPPGEHIADENQALLDSVDRDPEDDEDDEEGPGTREQLLAEMVSISNQMRVTHRHRRTFSRMTSTGQPLRPSLLGALEFGSVLQSLERNRTLIDPRPPSPGRRHSDNASPAAAQRAQSDQNILTTAGARSQASGTNSETASVMQLELPAGQRLRSVSANAADLLPYPRGNNMSAVAGALHLEPTLLELPSDTSHTGSPITRVRDPGPLAPLVIPEISVSDERGQVSAMEVNDDDPMMAFPRYTDDPLLDLVSSPGSLTPIEAGASWPVTRAEKRRASMQAFWHETQRILFPQTINWRSKGIADKIISLLTAPAIVGMTLTIPIGELGNDEPSSAPPIQSSIPRVTQHGAENATKSSYEDRRSSTPGSLLSSGAASPLLGPVSDRAGSIADAAPPEILDNEDICWNPYLMSIQIVASPLFLFLVIYKGWLGIEENDMELVIWICSVLGFSTTLLLVFWYNNRAGKAPSWQPWLSVPGFLVAIAWISSIADEVVGLLKAFQLITGFSEAILGLIVFAAGNSVSDLFANLNTARAGRPVMAFHACFGGPMLNILLGIGLGGMYHTIKKGRKHSSNGSAPLGTEFHIDVGRTLIVSGAGLLLTLVLLLLALWKNKWVMDRKIGTGLISLWATITVGNVVLEILQLQGIIKPW